MGSRRPGRFGRFEENKRTLPARVNANMDTRPGQECDRIGHTIIIPNSNDQPGQDARQQQQQHAEQHGHHHHQRVHGGRERGLVHRCHLRSERQPRRHGRWHGDRIVAEDVRSSARRTPVLRLWQRTGPRFAFSLQDATARAAITINITMARCPRPAPCWRQQRPPSGCSPASASPSSPRNGSSPTRVRPRASL